MFKVYDDIGKILFSVVRQVIVPFIYSGVNQFQTLSYLFQSDTRTTFIGSCLRLITVADGTFYLVIIFRNGDVYITGLYGRNPMLECIFYQ